MNSFNVLFFIDQLAARLRKSRVRASAGRSLRRTVMSPSVGWVEWRTKTGPKEREQNLQHTNRLFNFIGSFFNIIAVIECYFSRLAIYQTCSCRLYEQVFHQPSKHDPIFTFPFSGLSMGFSRGDGPVLLTVQQSDRGVRMALLVTGSFIYWAFEFSFLETMPERLVVKKNGGCKLYRNAIGSIKILLFLSDPWSIFDTDVYKIDPSLWATMLPSLRYVLSRLRIEILAVRNNKRNGLVQVALTPLLFHCYHVRRSVQMFKKQSVNWVHDGWLYQL